MDKTTQNHWDTVYKTKDTNQVSWTQEIPKTSLDFIHSFGLTKTAKIIDIGGGDLQHDKNLELCRDGCRSRNRLEQRRGDRPKKLPNVM